MQGCHHMKTRIDDVDRAILDCLREDARMQSSEIARRLGYMTSRAVRNRLQKLRNEGYVAITAGAVPEKLGFAISADIAIDVEPGMTQLVAQSLVELDEVYYVALTTGIPMCRPRWWWSAWGIYRLSSATNCIRSWACARRGLVCSPRCSSRAATGPFRKTFLNFEPLARSVARPRLEIGYGHNQATWHQRQSARHLIRDRQAADRRRRVPGSRRHMSKQLGLWAKL